MKENVTSCAFRKRVIVAYGKVPWRLDSIHNKFLRYSSNGRQRGEGRYLSSKKRAKGNGVDRGLEMRPLHVTNPLSKPGKQVLTEVETKRTVVFLAPGVETGRRRASKFCTFPGHEKEKYEAISIAY
jgi:hypothetical protein